MSTSHIVDLLIAERDRIQAAIDALEGSSQVAQTRVDPYDDPNMPDWVKPKAKTTAAPKKKKRNLSAEGRQRIIDATKARWAKINAGKAEAAPKKKAPTKKSAVLAAVTPSAEDAEFKSKMSAAMKKAWAKRKRAMTRKKVS